MAKSPKPPPSKKRNYARAPISIRIQYQEPRRGTKEGFTAILGGGGLFIDTLSPLPEGTPVSLEFGLPGQVDSVKVDGQVAWVRSDFDPKGFSPGMAVQFRKIKEVDREKIMQFVMRILLGQPEISP